MPTGKGVGVAMDAGELDTCKAKVRSNFIKDFFVVRATRILDALIELPRCLRDTGIPSTFR